MIKGIGMDIVEIKRIERLMVTYEKLFIHRILTDNEAAFLATIDCQNRKIEWVAGRFSAKEAISKAVGSGIQRKLTFKDMEILPDASGKPVAILHQGETSNIVHLSITHTVDLAASYAILEEF